MEHATHVPCHGTRETHADGMSFGSRETPKCTRTGSKMDKKQQVAKQAYPPLVSLLVPVYIFYLFVCLCTDTPLCAACTYSTSHHYANSSLWT